MKYFNISYLILITSVIIFNTHEQIIENKKIEQYICDKGIKHTPCVINSTRSICYDVICGFGDFPYNNNSIQSLTICNWPNTAFNLTVLKGLHHLKYLKIISKNITHFKEQIPMLNNLQVIELRNLSLHEIKIKQFQNIVNNSIQIFDLRGNQLEVIDKKFIESFHHLERIYLSGNSYTCSEKLFDLYKWMLINDSKIMDIQQISCGTNTSNLYYGKPILPMLQFIKAARKDCPSQCSCEVTYVVQHPKTGLTPFVAVYCQNIGLKDLPANLPINTTILHLEQNEITNLTALTENKNYINITDLYLDNNSISSIDVLEGTDWLNKFRILSLRGNQLHFVKTYILENAFEKNVHISRLHLGNNPWKCECHFIPVFQELLRKYSSVITDPDMTCTLEVNKKITYKPILFLSRSDLCKIPSTFKLEPLDILNIILASLIIIILGKLAYDYYSFKNSGKLPWIVLKMP